MKLFISANTYTGKQAEDCRYLTEVLEKKGHECLFRENGDTAEGCDLILSLGGDGALLRAAGAALEYDLPLLGINSGRLGYLCAMEIEEIGDFDELLGKCRINERTVLECGRGDDSYLAVNDVIVSKHHFGATVDLTVKIEGREDLDIRGDGLILATPTGSTAYNLSAGGPELDHDAPVYTLTPICPHKSGITPLVLSDEKEVKVFVNHDSAGLYVDGKDYGKSDEAITVRKSKRVLRLYERKN